MEQYFQHADQRFTELQEAIASCHTVDKDSDNRGLLGAPPPNPTTMAAMTSIAAASSTSPTTVQTTIPAMVRRSGDIPLRLNFPEFTPTNPRPHPTSEAHVLEDNPVSTKDEQIVELSMQAINGSTGSSALKLRGHIRHKPALILLDTRSTATFINSKLVDALHLDVLDYPEMTIALANGTRVVCSKTCPDLSWEMCRSHFRRDFRILNLGTYDIVLGIDWMQEVNPITFNFVQSQATIKGHHGDSKQLEELSCLIVGCPPKNINIQHVEHVAWVFEVDEGNKMAALPKCFDKKAIDALLRFTKVTKVEIPTTNEVHAISSVIPAWKASIEKSYLGDTKATQIKEELLITPDGRPNFKLQQVILRSGLFRVISVSGSATIPCFEAFTSARGV
ncbi:hypothetical protein EJ110_NYTH40030 [Nymphaea thermarum]|nr:hypothetical protein EJ110_NYTH40030 [Nymphaea thermarum]